MDAPGRVPGGITLGYPPDLFADVPHQPNSLRVVCKWLVVWKRGPRAEGVGPACGVDGHTLIARFKPAAALALHPRLIQLGPGLLLLRLPPPDACRHEAWNAEDEMAEARGLALTNVPVGSSSLSSQPRQPVCRPASRPLVLAKVPGTGPRDALIGAASVGGPVLGGPDLGGLPFAHPENDWPGDLGPPAVVRLQPKCFGDQCTPGMRYKGISVGSVPAHLQRAARGFQPVSGSADQTSVRFRAASQAAG